MLEGIHFRIETLCQRVVPVLVVSARGHSGPSYQALPA